MSPHRASTDTESHQACPNPSNCICACPACLVARTRVHSSSKERSRDEEYAALVEKNESLERARYHHLHRADVAENALEDVWKALGYANGEPPVYPYPLAEIVAERDHAAMAMIVRRDELETAIRDYLFEERREAAGVLNADRHRTAWKKLKAVVKWEEDSPEINCSSNVIKCRSGHE